MSFHLSFPITFFWHIALCFVLQFYLYLFCLTKLSFKLTNKMLRGESEIPRTIPTDERSCHMIQTCKKSATSPLDQPFCFTVSFCKRKLENKFAFTLKVKKSHVQRIYWLEQCVCGLFLGSFRLRVAVSLLRATGWLRLWNLRLH